MIKKKKKNISNKDNHNIKIINENKKESEAINIIFSKFSDNIISKKEVYNNNNGFKNYIENHVLFYYCV